MRGIVQRIPNSSEMVVVDRFAFRARAFSLLLLVRSIYHNQKLLSLVESRVKRVAVCYVPFVSALFIRGRELYRGHNLQRRGSVRPWQSNWFQSVIMLTGQQMAGWCCPQIRKRIPTVKIGGCDFMMVICMQRELHGRRPTDSDAYCDPILKLSCRRPEICKPHVDL